MTDPTGEFAEVRIWTEADGSTTVEITIPIDFDNQSRDSDAADKMSSNIEERWTGKFGEYNVVTKVEQRKGYNNVQIADGRTKGPHGSSYNENSEGNGQWTTDDVNGIKHGDTVAAKKEDTPAHEAGHLMGLGDRDGNQRSLMDDTQKNRKPSEQDIKEVIENKDGVNAVYDCVRSTGKCTPR